MSANTRQVGGVHYRSEYQHWDFIEDWGIGYLEGCASKYITRWRLKSGVQDVEKAIHYIEKLIERATAQAPPGASSRASSIRKIIPRKARGGAPSLEIMSFCNANGLSSLEITIFHDLCGYWDVPRLYDALRHTNELLDKARALQAG